MLANNHQIQPQITKWENFCSAPVIEPFIICEVHTYSRGTDEFVQCSRHYLQPLIHVRKKIMSCLIWEWVWEREIGEKQREYRESIVCGRLRDVCSRNTGIFYILMCTAISILLESIENHWLKYCLLMWFITTRHRHYVRDKYESKHTLKAMGRHLKHSFQALYYESLALQMLYTRAQQLWNDRILKSLLSLSLVSLPLSLFLSLSLSPLNSTIITKE